MSNRFQAAPAPLGLDRRRDPAGVIAGLGVPANDGPLPGADVEPVTTGGSAAAITASRGGPATPRRRRQGRPADGAEAITRQTKTAKLGRVHTVARRGLPEVQNPRVGTPGRSMHPWSSCTTGTARRSCRCRTARRQRRAARRDRRSGQRRGGTDAGSQGTSCRARRARPGALGRSGAAMPACCTGRCACCGWTLGRARCSDYLVGS